MPAIYFRRLRITKLAEFLPNDLAPILQNYTVLYSSSSPLIACTTSQLTLQSAIGKLTQLIIEDVKSQTFGVGISKVLRKKSQRLFYHSLQLFF